MLLMTMVLKLCAEHLCLHAFYLHVFNVLALLCTLLCM